MIIYGHRLFGKVDNVPGLGFVATKFLHIDYVPLVPTECWLVFEQTGKGWRGIRVPMSGKSVLTAWLRTGSVLGMLFGTIGLLVGISGGHAEAGTILGMLAIPLISAGLFAFTKLHRSVAHASYARACELGKLAKLNPNAMAAIAAAYGRQPEGGRPVPPAFQPVNVAPVDDSFPVEQIPLDEVDGIPLVDDQTPETPMATPPTLTPQQPRSESRRHG